LINQTTEQSNHPINHFVQSAKLSWSYDQNKCQVSNKRQDNLFL